VLLLALVLLAFALRLCCLDAQSLWYDEGVTAQVTSQGLAELTRWTADDIQPPLYYYLLAGWTRLAGRSEWSLRFPSAFFGTLTVPLLYLLGRRLFRRRGLLLVALLATISPLHVYYAQEARMYTQLTFLGALAGVLLLCLLDERRTSRRRWLWAAFAITSIAALYTHYFAAFLLTAYGLVFLLTIVRGAPWTALPASRHPSHGSRGALRAPLVEGAIALVAIVLAYVPWLPAMLTRFRTDASYWQGELKLNEALRHVLISFSMGETVLEPLAVRLMWGFLAVFALGLVGIVWEIRSRRTRRAELFLLLYLLVPLGLILLLSMRNPKFNPRYLMVASPAFLLSIGAGLEALWRRGCKGLRAAAGAFAASRILSAAACVLASAGVVFALATSVYALANWYADPAFSKADFRSVARTVRERISPDETVILTSGHLSPVWDYYAPDIERHRLPDIDILDVNATLGYHSADELNEALHGQQGVWTVLWQNDVVDPNGFLADFLTRAGEEEPVERSFWHVGLRHYRLPEGVAFSSEPPVEHEQRANFAGLVELLGWGQDASGAIRLYWRAMTEIEQDLQLALVLQDGQGHTWGRSDGRPAAYGYPTFRWRPGEVLFGRYELPAEPGTPPGGSYRLGVGLYDESDMAGLDVLDDSGNPQAKRVILEPVQVPQVVTGDVMARLLARPGGRQVDVTLVDGLWLLGYEFDAAPLRPGDQRTLTTIWRATASLPDITVRIRWLDAMGRVLGEDGFMPGVQGRPGTPTSCWEVGDVVRSQADLFLPPDVSADSVDLELTGLVSGQAVGEPLLLLSVAVDAPERVLEVPAVQMPIDAQLDFLVRLVGLDLAAETVAAGTTMPVTVTWQAVGDLRAWDLTGFVHLLASDGHVVAQEDHVPLRGERPTRGWLEGEVIVDRYDLDLPTDLAPGAFQLEVGLYLDDGTRLMVTEPERWRGQDSVLAGVVRVE
jgi:4-amino-4-deoxy-L-arabinose transferase-like glycosyltransferase